MTSIVAFKLAVACLAVVIGIIYARRRKLPVTNEDSNEVRYYVTGWDAVVMGALIAAFGVALFLDALGIVSIFGA